MDVGQEHNVIRTVYNAQGRQQDGTGKAQGGVVNRRGRGKARVLISVMDQAGCSGRDPDCLTPTKTGLGISARIHDSNSLGDKTREDPGSERRHAGTVEEGISARIHLANSHGDKAEEGRRNDRRHSANSLWERDDSCMSVGASIITLL